MRLNTLVLPLSALVLLSCSAHRSISHGAETLQALKFSGQLGVEADLPTETSAKFFDAAYKHAQSAYRDTMVTVDSASLYKDLSTLTQFALDPLGINSSVQLRMGLGKGFEIGYQYAGGNVFELHYQFLKGDGMHASVGVQYSSGAYELPSVLGDLQKISGFDLKRKDYVLPMSFGKSNKWSSWWIGPSLAYSKIEYGFNPGGLLVMSSPEVQKKIPNLVGVEHSYMSYGLHFGGRIGWKHLFLLGSLSSYYQNYGDYELPGMAKTNLSGLSFYPYVGVEIR